MFIKIYTDNVKRKIGVQGITWLIIPTNTLINKLALPVELGGYDTVRIIDNVLLYICVGFSAFALWIATSVLRNIRNGTSEPDKLKKKPIKT